MTALFASIYDLVDADRCGRVIVYEGQTVRIRGRNAQGAYVAAKADTSGRDTRPVQLIVVPANFKPAPPPHLIRRLAL